VHYSILIVDDSAVIRHSLRFWLEQNDWTVCGEAEDGQEAIDKAQQLRPDLVLLDLSMPRMNGFEAARELRRLHPSLPLLMFTSFETPDLEEQAIAAGCNMVISKSDSSQLLLNGIRRYLPAVA